MSHPFQDKLFVFIGTFDRCTRGAACDALAAIGGIADDNITAFTNYVVACNGAERTKVYQKAVKYARSGLLIILTEEQFYSILDGEAAPPIPARDNNIIVMPGSDPEGEQTHNDILNRKRMNHMAKYGVPLADGSRAKIDLRPLDMMSNITEKMKENAIQTVIRDTPLPEHCDNCGNPVKVHLTSVEEGETFNLCADCYNRLMADMNGIDWEEGVPQRLSYKSRGGKTHEFDIEYLIFPTGKSLTATELGKTKRKVDVFGTLDDNVYEMLETLKKRIKKSLSVTYMGNNGYIKGDKAVGYIEYNFERDDHDIIIDGKPYTWEELEKNIASREGWKIKIEFGDVGDELD